MYDWCQLKTVGVIGLGRTGRSVVSYLHSRNINIIAFEEDLMSSGIDFIKESYSNVECRVGAMSAWDWHELAEHLDLLVVSPGVDLRQPVLQNWLRSGLPLCGDIDIFCHFTTSSIVAVTGSNGKTTVSTLIAESLSLSGKTVSLAGNVGKPVLDLLQSPEAEYTVLELSSFQLESINRLRNHVGLVVNYSPDHMDRYHDFKEYVVTKNKIFDSAKIAIINADQSDCCPQLDESMSITFSLSGQADFMLLESSDSSSLMFRNRLICHCNELKLQGRHHYQNALILFSVMYALNLPMDKSVEVLKHFSGLKHRCQHVLTRHQVSWYNDSKATNEGAAIAAIQTIGGWCRGRIILLAGGDAKGGEFKALSPVVAQLVSCVIVYGKDKKKLFNVLSLVSRVIVVNDLEMAVQTADRVSESGDVVLLSPACSSLDMFENYEHRGEVFSVCVEELPI